MVNNGPLVPTPYFQHAAEEAAAAAAAQVPKPGSAIFGQPDDADDVLNSSSSECGVSDFEQVNCKQEVEPCKEEIKEEQSGPAPGSNSAVPVDPAAIVSKEMQVEPCKEEMKEEQSGPAPESNSVDPAEVVSQEMQVDIESESDESETQHAGPAPEPPSETQHAGPAPEPPFSELKAAHAPWVAQGTQPPKPHLTARDTRKLKDRRYNIIIVDDGLKPLPENWRSMLSPSARVPSPDPTRINAVLGAIGAAVGSAASSAASVASAITAAARRASPHPH